MPPSSVTTWLQLLRAGDPAAAQRLWERYYADLVRLAHDHLAARVRRGGDAEDVALSAFASFCRGADAPPTATATWLASSMPRGARRRPSR
jgi:DNA-directed RNA polymerase specialized sigma24 family protein